MTYTVTARYNDIYIYMYLYTPKLTYTYICIEIHFYSLPETLILSPVGAIIHVSGNHQFSMKMFDLRSQQIAVSVSALLDKTTFIEALFY